MAEPLSATLGVTVSDTKCVTPLVGDCVRQWLYRGVCDIVILGDTDCVMLGDTKCVTLRV